MSLLAHAPTVGDQGQIWESRQGPVLVPPPPGRLRTHSEVQMIPFPQSPQPVEAAPLVIILQELDTACRGSTARGGLSDTSTAKGWVFTAQRVQPSPTRTPPPLSNRNF